MKSNRIIKRISARNKRVRASSSSPKPMQSPKATFTKMTSEEHKNTRIKVYPYLIP